jgi:hypothetical protein
MGIIWGSILAFFFLKQGENIAPIYFLWNRTVLRAYFWEIHKKIVPCLPLRRQLIRRRGGGSPRSLGCGGESPHDIPSTQSGSSVQAQQFPEKSELRIEDFRKIFGLAAKDF